MLVDEFHGRRAKRFTLQWHLTHACDLHCKHCYDRTKVSVLGLDQALRILDHYDAFLDERGVHGSVCFTGGNPFLYRGFEELWADAAARGHRVSILGNPVPVERVDALLEVAAPAYYQVSLEGLKDHNDLIRGPGSFDAVMAFLPQLRSRGIRSIVMTTLTRANIDQVIPLGEHLRNRADRFTFNRLSQVGEGASLLAPERDDYLRFLIAYSEASKGNPILGSKDNLFNILRHHAREPLLGGCTGFGCGMAFNFVAVLPNGEVHACRKFPSPIGKLPEDSLAAIYDSQAARRYRRGCELCDGCSIRPRCGGCPATTSRIGAEALDTLDPHCFMFEIRNAEHTRPPFFVGSELAPVREAGETATAELVSFTYTAATLDGRVLASSDELGPVSCTTDDPRLPSEVLDALRSAPVGVPVEVTLSTSERYGVRSDSGVRETRRSVLPPDLDLTPGAQLIAFAPGTGSLPLWVESAESEQVTLEDRHPWAGLAIVFRLEVRERRAQADPTPPMAQP